MTKAEYSQLMLRAKVWPKWKLYAKTIWAEARGQSTEEKIAICHVMHRSESNKALWDNILSKWQFSCYNYGDPNFEKLMKVNIDNEIYRECIGIAFGVINDIYPDYAKGADHYFNPSILPELPSWAKKMTKVAQIDETEFYKA